MLKSKNKFTKSDTKKLLLNIAITAFATICIILIMMFLDNEKKEEQTRVEFPAINKICELATLRSYYHDVAEYEKQPDGLFKYGLFQYGYKKFWIEYDGIVEIGIDVGKVQVNEPDDNGIVRIYVPEAEILNINADLDSMNELISETGIFTKITASEKAEAFAVAQATMKNNVETDSSILIQAHNNAKELLKQYVIKVGEQMGQQYTVEWISVPMGKEIQKGE